MTDTIEKRACEAAVYVIETGATVRAAARHLGISKSTVHKDLTQRLKQYNYALYLQVREILDENKRERHIRRRDGHKTEVSASIVGNAECQIIGHSAFL